MAKRRAASVKISESKKEAYFKSLGEIGAITAAADAAGVAHSTIGAWRKSDPEFIGREQQAAEIFADRLEAEAVRRAVKGVLRKKFDKGQPIIDPSTDEQYVEREYDTTLLIFMLKGSRPDKYKERLDVRVTKEEAEIDERFAKLVEETAVGSKAGVGGEEGAGARVIADGQAEIAAPPPTGLLGADM